MAKPSLKQDETLLELPTLAESHVYAQIHQNKKSFSTRKRDSHLDEPRNLGRGDIEAIQHMLPITVGNKKGITLPAGLIVVSGASAAGKSEFFRGIGRMITVNRVLAVEPPDDAWELENLPIFNSADAGLLSLVFSQLNGDKRLPVLDSLRESLFEINGPAGAKGIVNAFFTAITRVSNALAKNGLTVIASVNPMNKETDYVQEFLNKLSSAVPGFIVLESRLEDSRGLTFSGTVAFRPDRVPRRFTVTTPKNGDKTQPVDAGEDVVFVTNKSQDEYFTLSAGERALIAEIQSSDI